MILSQGTDRGTGQVIISSVEGSTHCSPPEGVSISGKLLVIFLLSQIDQEGGKDQYQEANVPGCDQLLKHRERKVISLIKTLNWRSNEDGQPSLFISVLYCLNMLRDINLLVDFPNRRKQCGSASHPA